MVNYLHSIRHVSSVTIFSDCLGVQHLVTNSDDMTGVYLMIAAVLCVFAFAYWQDIAYNRRQKRRVAKSKQEIDGSES